MERLFDLNIEQVLEHWEVAHAVREIIANALDEQIITKTRQINIYKDDGKWYIRDYGRGLNSSHFTQNENQEKISSPHLIGKFGVGLKDALAVFYRKNIEVVINSKFARITLQMANKTGFEIQTLHAFFEDSINKTFEGTEFILSGITDEDIEKAKSMFLCFNDNAKLLEITKYGEIYQCLKSPSIIYINGVQVATEENFLFCYNITNINSQIKKALNRERSNVGRTAYSDTIKNILRQSKSNEVLLPLVDDLKNVMMGTNKDESSWVDIATYAAKKLNNDNNVVFMTPWQRANLTNQQVEILEHSGKKLIMVTDNVFDKIENSVQTFNTVYQEYNDAYSYKFVSYENLSESEQEVFNFRQSVIKFLEINNYKYDIPIKISETIRISSDGFCHNGCYDHEQKAIIILRSVLSNKTDFLGVLLHEFAHYQHGYTDNTRDFENELTDMLGLLFAQNL